MEQSFAPGAPGSMAKWTSSAKSGIGKALDTASQVAFTLSHGIMNEVYFPREDIACIRDLGLIVTDGKTFFSEEKRSANSVTKTMHEGVPAYKIVNSCILKKYKITKEIIADPLRNTILQKLNFEALEKGSFQLYALLAPHLNNQGNNNTGWVGDYKGVPMLFAKSGGLSLALACSANWLKRSVGFVGVSDGWIDLKEHKKMEWQYTNAEGGNIALTGEIDLKAGKEFVLALGLGRNPEEAANHALGSLLDGFEFAMKYYIKNWEAWFENLKHVNSRNYKISAAVLRMNEAKTFPGGIIASMSIPWGQSKGDGEKGGYHLVWPRDLVESAGGFLALETKEDALRIVNYLMSTQEQDGSWPQNMWLEGSPHWKGKQTDQTALPLLLVDKCYQQNAVDKDRFGRYWPLIKKSIGYLIKNGPYTQQDRWEEEKGFSPFTIAAVIAGMLSAAEIADANNEGELANYCRETADNWNDSIEEWTYTANTGLAKELGVDGYYIRINPFSDIPATALGDRTINLKNHKHGSGVTKLNELICVDALALVRFGLRSAKDPKILNTIKAIDTKLMVETPSGKCWHRYNNDGYGEHENGEPYDGTGIGRAWPLLTGERAHYEIAAGNISGAKELLEAINEFSNNGLLSEQIWDTKDIPEKELIFGKHSGSAMPLTWAHAEHIKLCASLRNKKVFDMPLHTQERYLKRTTISNYTIWRFDAQSSKIDAAKKLRIELTAAADIVWTIDSWQTKHTTTTKDFGVGIYVADIGFTANKHNNILAFTFFWTKSQRWENKDFIVERIVY